MAAKTSLDRDQYRSECRGTRHVLVKRLSMWMVTGMLSDDLNELLLMDHI